MATGSSYAAMRDAADGDPDGLWGKAADLVGWFHAPARTFE
jgi:hypothetical protein